MRAILLAQHFVPTFNPGTRRWRWLTENMAELGLQCTVIGPQSQPFDALEPIELRSKPAPQKLGIVKRSFHEIARALEELPAATTVDKPDVIIATVPPMPELVTAVLSALRWNVPLVLDLRDAWPELIDTWREWGADGRVRRYGPVLDQTVDFSLHQLRAILRFLQKRADAVVTTTDAHARYLRALGFRRVICVPNVPAALQPVSRPAPHEEFRVLYIGKAGRAQRLETAVRAAALIKDEIAIKLRIVGGGVQIPYLRKLAEKLEAPVEFSGYVLSTLAYKQYEWCDSALVMLRDWHPLELSVPSKLYEAIGFGVHVSLSAAGESARIVNKLSAGDVVAPDNPQALAELWLQLAKDRSRLDMPASISTQIRENFDRKVLAKRYFDLLCEVSGA